MRYAAFVATRNDRRSHRLKLLNNTTGVLVNREKKIFGIPGVENQKKCIINGGSA